MKNKLQKEILKHSTGFKSKVKLIFLKDQK